jgi:methionine-rich copper-binding protein CopC
VANDTNGVTDVFVHERQAAAQPDDCIAPTTTHTLSPSPNAAGWNNSDVIVSLDATDTGGSGAKEIRYSATGADAISEQTVAAANLPATFTVDAEGITTISYSAIDNAGNQESPKTLTVKIDKTAPSVSSTSPSNNATGVAAADNISATFSESGSGIDLESISTDTFQVVQLKPTGNVPVSLGTFSLTDGSEGSQTVTFDPDSSLVKGAYRVTIAGVKDKAGNTLANAYTWQFATAGPSKR